MNPKEQNEFIIFTETPPFFGKDSVNALGWVIFYNESLIYPYALGWYRYCPVREAETKAIIFVPRKAKILIR